MFLVACTPEQTGEADLDKAKDKAEALSEKGASSSGKDKELIIPLKTKN